MYGQQETEALLMELASNPSPSGKENMRVSFVASWLEKIGCDGVIVEEAKNVIYTYHPSYPGRSTSFARTLMWRLMTPRR